MEEEGLLNKLDLACDSLVGDKLNKDALSAQNAGAISVWYNAKGENLIGDIHPDYIVSSLDEMKSRLPD